MKKFLCLITATVLVSLIALSAKAQDNGINSPFSRYGIGTLSNQAQGFNQGMAGVAYGMHSGDELNFKNPASYSTIDSITCLFDLGATLQNGNFDTGKQAANVRNASLDYISAGFRLKRGLGMSIGLMPISNIGYKMSYQGKAEDYGITGEVTPTITYNGTGGLREAYIGVGYAPIKQLSIGVNAGYVWGTMSHGIANSYSDATVQDVNRAYSTHIRTFDIDAGLQYHQRINSKNSISLGLVYSVGHDIPGESYFYNQKISNNAVLEEAVDTANNAWSLPHTFGGGLTWKYKNSLRIGFDYTLQQWSHCLQPVYNANHYYGSREGYNDCHRFALGAEYVKDPHGLSWASRVRYRAGFSYGTSYAKLQNEFLDKSGTALTFSDGPKSYLATIGVALPIINIYNNRSFLNISLQYERVQPSKAGQLTENYFRLCLGINFNERWFMKWKVE